MPFDRLSPFNARLPFHTSLYLAFRQRGREQEIHVQAYGAMARPYFWLDDLNFGALFGPRGELIRQELARGVKPAKIKLPNDHKNKTGCTFVSGLSIANDRRDPVWRAPLALALGMTPNPNGRWRGRFMVEPGTNGPIWLGHRGGHAGGGEGVITIAEFRDLLPNLGEFLGNNRQHLGLIAELTHAFEEIFAYNFVPDDLHHLPHRMERVFPIAAYGTENFFQRLASYVHQCYVIGRLRANGVI